ncbi:MAG TPA: transglutaminase domain-containing protein [Chthoniobacterales bacterium]
MAVLFFNWSGLSLIRASSTDSAATAATSSKLENAFKNLDATVDKDFSAEASDAAAKRTTVVPREAFDVKAKAAQLGKNVDKIFAFVRDEVRFEAYSGVLRGPRGTLMAGAGNSFDRALLLGSLLHENGFEMRYVHGVLDDEKASLLISTMLSTDAPASGPKETEPEELSVELKKALRDLGEVTIDRWVNNVHRLQAALRRKAKLWDEQKRSAPTLISEVRDHVWVEYRQNNEWITLDPIASSVGLEQNEPLTSAKETWGTIPSANYHKITFLLIQEEKDGDSRTTRELLKHEARADELDAAEVSFRFDITQSGMGWSATPLLLINGRVIRGRNSAGSGLDAGAANLGARLFSRPGQPPKKGGGEATAAWLEFKFTSPTGEVETLRREIFDRLGFAVRELKEEDKAPLIPLPEKGGIPLYVGNQYAFSFSSGPIHPGLVQSYFAPHLEAIRAAYPLTQKLQAENRPPTQAETSQLNKLVGATLPMQLGTVARSFHMLSSESLALIRDKDLWEHLHLYAAVPRLAIASIEPRLDEQRNVVATVSLDLRRNDLRAVGKDIDPAQLAWANVIRGVLDAVLEDMVIRMNLPARERANSLSTVAMVERAAQGGAELTALAGGEDIASIKSPEAIHARMNANAGSGILLVASPSAIKIRETERLGWWRVNMISGDTLGIMDTGLHQSNTENAMVISTLAIGIVGALYTFFEPMSYSEFINVIKTGRIGDDMTSLGTNGAPVR